MCVGCCCSWGGIFWKGGVGYVTRDILAAHMPPVSLGSGALVMVCGPPGEAHRQSRQAGTCQQQTCAGGDLGALHRHAGHRQPTQAEGMRSRRMPTHMCGSHTVGVLAASSHGHSEDSRSHAPHKLHAGVSRKSCSVKPSQANHCLCVYISARRCMTSIRHASH